MRPERDTSGPTERSFGRYHLHRQIAKGGMARIHIARSIAAEGVSRIVAAKRLDPQLAGDEAFVEMFLDEARVASRVRHRNVVPVLDVVTMGDEVIIVQELVHGAPLHKLCARAQLANQRIPVDVAVAIATQVLAGLHAAHETVDETGVPLDIVHRDVSPQNIMIAADGTARLLDFGVAKTAAAAHVTRVGTFKGKLSYSSAEQLEGHATRQTDVYALAIVLWELLAGQRLYGYRSDGEVYGAIMHGSPLPITRVLAPQRAHIADAAWLQLVALEPIVARALSRDLTERHATAEELERALLAAVEPAPQPVVAAWLRTLAQDMLDQTDQLIAEEEESWRKAKGSGVLPVIPSGPQRPRSSTSLETQGAKPSTLPHLIALDPAELAPVRPTRRARLARAFAPYRLPLAATAVVVLVLVASLVFATSSKAHRANAAPAPAVPVTLPAVETAPPVIVSVTREVKPPKRATTRVTKRRAVKRRPAIQPLASDCSIPFYYEGTKKRFKPSCI